VHAAAVEGKELSLSAETCRGSGLGPGTARCGPLPTAARPSGADPKPDGRKRELGVASVVDRLICQAISQVLSPDLRSRLFGTQLRVPSEAQRPPGRRGGQGLRQGGLGLGRGPRPRVVLRSLITLSAPPGSLFFEVCVFRGRTVEKAGAGVESRLLGSDFRDKVFDHDVTSSSGTRL